MLTQNISGIQIISNISPNIRLSPSKCLESKDLACPVFGIKSHHPIRLKENPTKQTIVLTCSNTCTDDNNDDHKDKDSTFSIKININRLEVSGGQSKF